MSVPDNCSVEEESRKTGAETVALRVFRGGLSDDVILQEGCKGPRRTEAYGKSIFVSGTRVCEGSGSTEVVCVRGASGQWL